MDKLLHGQIHLFCALADALARSNALSKVDLLAAVRSKLEWLTRANTSFATRTPLMLADAWLTAPPIDPANPFAPDPTLRLVKGH